MCSSRFLNRARLYRAALALDQHNIASRSASPGHRCDGHRDLRATDIPSSRFFSTTLVGSQAYPPSPLLLFTVAEGAIAWLRVFSTHRCSADRPLPLPQETRSVILESGSRSEFRVFCFGRKLVRASIWIEYRPGNTEPRAAQSSVRAVGAFIARQAVFLRFVGVQTLAMKRSAVPARSYDSGSTLHALRSADEPLALPTAYCAPDSDAPLQRPVPVRAHSPRTDPLSRPHPPTLSADG